MRGLGGDDAYIVDNADDLVIEAANGGTDKVVTSCSYTLGNGVETLRTTVSGTAAIDLTGNQLTNLIIGNRGANELEGGRGNDVLIGGGGRDTFIFSRGDGADKIRDYQAGLDSFDLTGATGADRFEDLHLTQIHSKVRIDFDGNKGGDSLTLLNTTIAELRAHQSDFDFV